MAGSSWGTTPRESVEKQCALRGKDEFVAGCVDLFTSGEGDPDLILALGGPPARWAVTGELPGPPYWLRVWALRGLLWAWDDVAFPAVETGLHDESWRVREMALKVIARHRLEAASATAADLQGDANARVRAAASRAMMQLAASGKGQS